MGHWRYIEFERMAGMRGSRPADLGRIARQRRVDLEWSQEELASKAEVTRQWLTRFETGKGDPSLSKVLRVLRELRLHLDVTPEERAASVRPRVTVPVYEPIQAHTSLSSALAAMRADTAGALEQLSRSQQQMRAQGQLPSVSGPASGEDREDPK